MKKNITNISDEIYLINNFISNESAKYMSEVFNKHLIETDRENVLGGPSSDGFTPLEWIGEYKDNDEFNVAIDLLNGITSAMAGVLSEKYKMQLRCKQSFFGAMMVGSNNDLHMDNYRIKKDGSIVPRENNEKDVSGILYLSDSYTGGMLEFPNQNISIKPDPGSFIFFVGDTDKPHRVTEVESGIRNVYITFFEPVN
jgi:hypothetical protein